MAKLAIFDIDGTLVQSAEIDALCFIRSVREEFGITDIDERWESYRHVTDSGIFEEIFELNFFRKPTKPEIQRHVRRFSELLGEYYLKDPYEFQPVPGAPEIIDYLKEHSDWRYGIATGTWRETALLKLKFSGIDPGTAPLVSGSDAKTREAIVRKCIESSKLHYRVSGFGKIVSVGDGIWDFRTAAALRLGFIRIAPPTEKKAFPQCSTLSDYTDVTTFLSYMETAQPPDVSLI